MFPGGEVLPLYSLMLSSNHTHFNNVPIHNVPNAFDIVWSQVPIVHIVSMLPNINAQEWNEASSRLQRILVGAGGNLNASLNCKQTNESEK